MIQINKQLIRLDKGTLSAGSLIDFKPAFLAEKKIVLYTLRHWFNQLAKDEEGWTPVPGVIAFEYKLNKECTEEEWLSLNDAGSAELVEVWLQEIIDSKIGAGNTIII